MKIDGNELAIEQNELDRRVPSVNRESLWSRSFTISHIHMGK